MFRKMSLPDELAAYHFELDPALIAQSPAPEREGARLLVVRRDPSGGLPRFEDLQVRDLPELVRATPRLRTRPWVRNRSRVLPARFYARRPSGGRHEIVLLEEEGPGLWKALVRNQAAFKYPQTLKVEGTDDEIFSPAPGIVDLSAVAADLFTWLLKVGEMPLPPYIKDRKAARDLDRYQPTWADPAQTASVAAPTASLHFSPALEKNLRESGVHFTDLYLHVGLGTFEPVREEKLSQHELHSERLLVPAESRGALREPGLTAVGTTALRALESLALWEEDPEKAQAEKIVLQGEASLSGRTSLFVRPPAPSFRRTGQLLTNFHLPESTLFVLVACFCGSLELAQEAYAHARARGYRFFSYGDASLWL